MRLALAACALAVASCAGGPPAPEWEATAHGALKGFQSAYLAGRTQAAEQEFARARSALAATGRAELVARAELVRCAARVASLDFDDCPGYRALAADAPPAERAYAAYLAGKAQAGDLALLPEHHRSVSADNLAAIADPFSATGGRRGAVPAGRHHATRHHRRRGNRLRPGVAAAAAGLAGRAGEARGGRGRPGCPRGDPAPHPARGGRRGRPLSRARLPDYRGWLHSAPGKRRPVSRGWLRRVPAHNLPPSPKPLGTGFGNPVPEPGSRTRFRTQRQ